MLQAPPPCGSGRGSAPPPRGGGARASRSSKAPRSPPPLRHPRGEEGVEAGVLQAELRVLLKEMGHHPLVLLGGEGAGGVDQDPPRAHQPRGLGEEALLHLGHPPGSRGPPVAHGLLVLAEHPLSGAGGVQEDPVEIGPEGLGQGPRGGLGHGQPRPPALHVLQETPYALAVHLVGQEKAPSPHAGGQVGGLAPRGRRQVQDPLPGPRVQKHPHRLGAGLLDVVEPGIKKGVRARPGFLRVVKPFLAPGDGREGPGSDFREALGGKLQGVHP